MLYNVKEVYLFLVVNSEYLLKFIFIMEGLLSIIFIMDFLNVFELC